MTGDKVSNTQTKWDRFALLLIDVQNDFWPEHIQKAFPDFKNNVASLLKLCRQEGIEVIHLRARFNPDKSGWMPIYKLGRRMPCVDGTSGVELLEEAREIPGELVIEKQCFDGKQKVIHVSSVTSNYLSLTGINSVVRIGVLGKFFLITVTFLWVCRQVFDELPLHTVMVQ